MRTLCAYFTSAVAATAARTALIDAGIEAEAMSLSATVVSPEAADAPATPEVSANHAVSPGAESSAETTVIGVAIGGAVGAVVGVVTAPVLGPISVAAGVATGAYAGSLVGALSGLDAADDAATTLTVTLDEDMGEIAREIARSCGAVLVEDQSVKIGGPSREEATGSAPTNERL